MNGRAVDPKRSTGSPRGGRYTRVMEATHLATHPQPVRLGALRLSLEITDPEVLRALDAQPAGAARDAFAREALRIGVVALGQASGAIDARAIEREGQRMLGAVKDAVTEALGRQSEAIARQFSLDRKDSALSRLLAEVAATNGTLHRQVSADLEGVAEEFSLDNEDGALARLRREVVLAVEPIARGHAELKTDLRAAIEGLRGRRDEAARSTRQGVSFEAAVGDFARGEAERAGDLFEAVGATKGRIDRKVGDHVIALGPESIAPGARIVLEAKAEKGLKDGDALEELRVAKENRGAGVGVFVWASAAAPEGMEPIRRIGSDVIVRWDAEDPSTDVFLRVALSLARALVIREQPAGGRSDADLEEIDRVAKDLGRAAEELDELVRASSVVRTKGEAIHRIGSRLREQLIAGAEALSRAAERIRPGQG